MSRTNDFVFIFNGGRRFDEHFPVEQDFNTQLWIDAEKKLSYRRKLFKRSCGVDEHLNSNVRSIINQIAVFVDELFFTIGRVCLLGRSAGAGLALGVAAALNDKLVGEDQIVFVGLSDLPMYDNGWNPPINLVGDLKPTNSPVDAGMRGSLTRSFPLDPSDPKSNSIPLAVPKPDIQAQVKRQIYQIQGNHTKYASSLNRWIWTCTGKLGGEVHGKIDLDAWKNDLFHVNPKFQRNPFDELDFDLRYHVELNEGEHWKDMCHDAALKFSDLPAQPIER